MQDFFGHDAQYLAHIMLNRLTSQEFDQIFKQGQLTDPSFSHTFATSCAVDVVNCLSQSEQPLQDLASIMRRFVNAISVLSNDDFYFSVSYLESQLIEMFNFTYKKDNCVFFKPEVETIIHSQFVTRTNLIKELFLSDYKK